jgi:lambda family phage minor tail protein L
MPIPYADLRNLSQSSAIVELFTLNATNIGGGVYRFCNYEAMDGGAVYRSGVPFYPMPIIMDGFGRNTTGPASKPTLSVSNVSKELLAVVISLGDLVDAKISRDVVYAKHLDGGASPDSTQIIESDVFIVDQKVLHTNRVISWALSVPYDVPGTMLPYRQVFRDPTHNSTGFPAVGRGMV